MVDEENGDAIKLIDFGIAGDAGARRLTYANITAALGTPNYIAPEQVKGRRGDARTDLYSMGVMLYEMLTGKLPFSGPTPVAAMNDRLLNHPIPPSVANPAVSPQLQEVIYRALERDPKTDTPQLANSNTTSRISNRSGSRTASKFAIGRTANLTSRAKLFIMQLSRFSPWLCCF